MTRPLDFYFDFSSPYGYFAAAQIEALAKALIESVSRPYLIERNQVSIGASVGIAIAPDDGQNDDELTRNADLSLYAAKAAGRGVHRPQYRHGPGRRQAIRQNFHKNKCCKQNNT